MSYQDVRHHYEDRDDEDEPNPVMIPASVAAGQRFMRKAAFRWDVCDWCRESCEVCYGSGSVPNPESRPPISFLPYVPCRCCDGTGEGPLVPERMACDLNEQDARLLVFGTQLLAACQDALQFLRKQDYSSEYCRDHHCNVPDVLESAIAAIEWKS